MSNLREYSSPHRPTDSAVFHGSTVCLQIYVKVPRSQTHAGESYIERL